MIDKIETTGEFKKLLKNFIKGAIKTKFFEDDQKMNDLEVMYKVSYSKKDKEGRIKFKVRCTFYEVEYFSLISTRIYNKLNDDLFMPIIEQLRKNKNVKNIIIKLVDDNYPNW